MTQTFNENVVVQGSDPNTTQLTVQGGSGQTAPLQTWQDNTPQPVARIAANGRVQTGDLNPGLGTQDALVEANASFDALPASKPQRGCSH